MPKLYELTENHRALQKLVDDEDLPTEAIKDTFEGIEGEFNDKAISLITVVNNIKSDTDAIDAEIKRLQDRKKTKVKAQDSMKEYLRSNMEATGISKIECPLFSITLANGRDIVQIDDETSIPPDYIDIKMTSTPMKKEILADMKTGAVIPGASIGKSKPSLRIK